MVAKISYGSSIYGAVSYNQEKVDAKEAKVIYTNNMINDISSADTINFSQTLRSFEDYLSANTRIKSPVAHFSLNPTVEDNLSDQDFSLLAHDYMEKMGYKDQPYIVYKHEDIERRHIHIVSVRIDENGKKISDSRDFKKSMDACRELETKYGLKQISNQSKEESIPNLKKLDYEKGDIKRQISNTLKSLIKEYKFQSFGEFNALLSCYNIHSKVVKGEEKGNVYTGIIYNAKTDRGDLVGNPIKSSLIGKMAGYEFLNKRMNKHVEDAKTNGLNTSDLKNTLGRLMQHPLGKEQFLVELRKHNFDAVFRENEEGRIYGATFIDHNQKTVSNGSRLGKEFSANIFHKLFNESPASLKNETSISQPAIQENTRTDNHFAAPVDVDEIFGVFHLNHNGYDAQEEEFTRRMKRKKKKGKKPKL